MADIPPNSKIYHITHVRNLSQIVEAGALWSDARRAHKGLDFEIVGMPKIKRRRLEELHVTCHPGTKVGEYVPFYFCPRSIMLFILYRGNHPDLDYTEGQRPIVHLQADLWAAIQWAQENACRWAVSDCNAGARHAQFFNSTHDLDRANWTAVAATDFRDMVVKEGKQAEFLMCGMFPWELIEKVGVLDAGIAGQVRQAISGRAHTPPVEIERRWYY